MRISSRRRKPRERAAEITTTPTLEQRRADALQNIARTFLDAEPDDRSGEDRHLVVVQVSAEALTQDVPAGTPWQQDGARRRRSDVHRHRRSRGNARDLRSARHGPARDAHRRAPRLHRQGRDLDHRCRWRDPSSGQVTALGVAGSASRPASSRHHLQLPRLSPVAASRRPSRGPVVRGRSHRHRGSGPAVQASPRDGPRRRIAAGTLPPATGAPPGRRFTVVDAAGRPVQARWPAMFEHLSIRSPRHRDRRCRCRCRSNPERIAATTGRRRLPPRGLCGRPLRRAQWNSLRERPPRRPPAPAAAEVDSAAEAAAAVAMSLNRE